jgi:hypothetical protein
MMMARTSADDCLGEERPVSNQQSTTAIVLRKYSDNPIIGNIPNIDSNNGVIIITKLKSKRQLQAPPSLL